MRVVRSGIDDGLLTPGAVSPIEWTMALAFLKSRAGQRASGDEGVFMGADTMVVLGDRLVGQPKDGPDARRMIADLSGGDHEVDTGVALVYGQGRSERRLMFADVATVRVGVFPDAAIDAYVASGEWRGKAGAYNLIERVEAGWPIEWEGDPGTVMGLPMVRLRPMLERILEAGAAARP